MLVHERHEALLDLLQLFQGNLFLSLYFRKLFLHASKDLSIGLKIAQGLVRLEFVLLCLVCKPGHILLELFVLCLKPLALLR